MLHLEQDLDLSPRTLNIAAIFVQERKATPVRLRPAPATLRVPKSWYVDGKPVLECLASIALLIALAPLIALAALMVKLTSKGPALYSQTRLGLRGRPFTIYKLRTMFHDCERHTGPAWSSKNDPRITWLGNILRLTHIDELPQLWNVIRGDMSLIGPRPERPEFAVELEKVLPAYRGRLEVRPGITGLAQIHLAPDTSVESVRRKLKYDLVYVARMNFWLDVRIALVTVLSAAGFTFHLTRRHRPRQPR